jgi:Xaa-Pro dipeptidase
MEHRPPFRFSLAERDRRWERVRELMALAGLDILIAADAPNSRYLTGSRAEVGATIFTSSGDLTLLSAAGPNVDSAWVSDVRPPDHGEIESLIARLSELNADRRIVAVTGLDPTVRRPRGNFNYLTFIALREWFPHTRWVGASQLMDEARWQKSNEEIDAIAAAAKASEAAIQAAVGNAGQSGTVRERWAEMLRTVIASGGDPSSEVAVATSSSSQSTRDLEAIDRPVMPDDILEATVLARMAGYGALATQPLLVDAPPPGVQAAWTRLATEWERILGELAPGRPLTELVTVPDRSDGSQLAVRLDGMGLGGDLPCVSSLEPISRDVRERTLGDGVCFAVDLTLMWTERGQPRRLRWADTVVCTPAGARRLGSRPLTLLGPA